MATPSNTSVTVRNLNFSFPDGSSGLQDLNLDLPAGSRALLIGANGAGKTTLLRLLAGKRMAPSGTITINGIDPFTHGLTGVTYLGLEWVLNPIVRTDIDVVSLLASIGGEAYPDRRDELVRILDIDVTWRLHAVSDGERRRVQLAMGLLRPWSVLLLDEVTVDLDLLSRHNFLEFLKRETEERGATVVYATHIVDNLNAWPSHLVHMSLGRIKKWGPVEEMNVVDTTSEVEAASRRAGNSRLGQIVLRWLADDLVDRGPRQKQPSQGKTYESHEGKGGYGQEHRK